MGLGFRDNAFVTRWAVFGFCGLALFLTLFFRLGNLPFVGADEPRYARIGEEMLVSGNFVTPTLEYRPWLEKPPLLFWLESFSYSLLGVSETTARLPVALLAALCACWMAYFAYQLLDGETAVLVLLILPTSALFLAFGRFATTDMPLAAFLTLALGSAYLAGRGRDLGWAVVSGAALAVATLAKGPVAVVLFGGVALLFSIWQGRLLWNWKQAVAGAAVFVMLSVPWYWLVWQEAGFGFVSSFWINHHLARFLTPFHRHSQPFWYYLPVLVLGFYPWTFFLGSNLVRLWRARRSLESEAHGLEVYLWCWVLVPVVFFSISGSKLAGYVLPVFPALALVAAMEWKRFLGGDLVAFRTMRTQVAVLVAATFLIGLVLVFGGLFVYRSGWVGPLLAAPLLAGVLWGRYEHRRRRSQHFFLSMVASMTLFAALAFGPAARVFGSFHSAKAPALAALPLISEQEPLIQFRYFHHTAAYYTRYQATPQGIPNSEALFDYLLTHPQERYLVLTKEHGWQIIEREIGCSVVMQEGNLYLLSLTPG